MNDKKNNCSCKKTCNSVCTLCKCFWKKIRFIFYSSIIFSIAITLLYFEYHYVAKDDLFLLTFGLVFATGMLALIAYRELKNIREVSEKTKEQLKEMSKSSKCDFTLRVDQRYSSPEMLEARTIIQKLYCEAKKNKGLSTKQYKERVSKAILNKAFSEKDEDIKDWIILVNFLDFLETISYLSNHERRTLKKEDVKETLGGAILFYHEIFSLAIKHLQEHYNDICLYKEIGLLCAEIIDKKCEKPTSFECETCEENKLCS